MTEAAKRVSGDKAAVVIGGGLGRSEETKDTVLEYLRQINIPCVIDADGIHAISKNPEVISGKPFLLTPHSYEFFILSGQKVEGKPLDERIKLTVDEAERLKTTILLKGQVDIVASSEKKDVALDRAGSPYMTKGGTGDTLAGIAGALLAKGTDLFTAGAAAAFLNGTAGERAAKKFGESMLATDLIEEIPNILIKI